MGPRTEFSDALHAAKYRGPGESFREAMNRIAAALADSDDHFRNFRRVLLDMRFLPGGRVQAAVGTTKAVTPFNCFVSGTFLDSLTDGHGSIMQRATEAATIMQAGGGIGYDFSTLRPRGATLKRIASTSAGPVAFMGIFDAICRCLASSGHRRGAQMGVMRIDHPDIEEFIRAKQNSRNLSGFNLSVAVTDEFMESLYNGYAFPLRFGGEVYREVDPTALWNVVLRSAWDWGEPGILFIDRINVLNNLNRSEKIATTNPCGEQPLPPFGTCLLGSFNLPAYLIVDNQSIDVNCLREDVYAVVRAMDKVIDVAVYPLPQHAAEARTKRRLGLGVTGVATALEAMGLPYGSAEFCAELKNILHIIANAAYHESARLAREKGAFPLCDEDYRTSAPFLTNLSPYVRDLIAEVGTRNSHLLSIAPAGTISLCADNVTSGIEPVVDYEVDRVVASDDGPTTVRLQDYGFRFLATQGRRLGECSIDDHLCVLQTATLGVDSSVSKTINVPPSVPWADFVTLFDRAWVGGCKGLAVFRWNGKRPGVIQCAANGQCG